MTTMSLNETRPHEKFLRTPLLVWQCETVTAKSCYRTAKLEDHIPESSKLLQLVALFRLLQDS